jgi:hypothetical protein
MTRYRLGEGLVEHADRDTAPQSMMLGAEMFIRKTLRTGFFPAAVDLEDTASRPCRSSGFGPPLSWAASRLAPWGDPRLTWLADC